MTNENDIKRLTEKYFNGDISPEETHSLLEAADTAEETHMTPGRSPT